MVSDGLAHVRIRRERCPGGCVQVLQKTLPLWLSPQRAGYLFTFDDFVGLNLVWLCSTPLEL
jgi:hypothetical protein